MLDNYKCLEISFSLKPQKRKEFKQTLDSLKVSIQNLCSSLSVDESVDGLLIVILFQWETVAEMYQALISEDFKVLKGAINSLGENLIIQLDNKEKYNQISILNNLVK